MRLPGVFSLHVVQGEVMVDAPRATPHREGERAYCEDGSGDDHRNHSYDLTTGLSADLVEAFVDFGGLGVQLGVTFAGRDARRAEAVASGPDDGVTAPPTAR